MKRKILFSLSAILISVGAVSAGLIQEDWQSLFDGKTTNGWRVMAVHGGNGGVWTVENGALVGNQEKDHKGGLIGTERKYGDFEIELEFKIDHPADSGLFLRTREDGMGYQITIDNVEGGFIGSLYAPAEGGFIQQNKDWVKVFRKNDWNKLKARVEGQPAHVTSWLNSIKMSDYTDTRERYPREGYIGLQVHGGGGSWGDNSRARYRNIRLREIKK